MTAGDARPPAPAPALPDRTRRPSSPSAALPARPWRPPDPSPDLLARAWRRWGVKLEPEGAGGVRPHLLGGSHCRVYGLDGAAPWRVLRLDRDGWFRRGTLHGELDWVRHLARQAVPVCAPLPSCGRRWVERLHDDRAEGAGAGGRYLATCFQRAHGAAVGCSHAELWNAELFRLCGRTLGQIHAASRTFRPRRRLRRRWGNRSFAWLARRALGHGDRAVLRRIADYHRRFARLSRAPADYGVIHGDFQPGNFHVHAGRIEVFDFGSAAYGWYAADIAISLWATLLERAAGGETALEPHARAYIVPFLRGYREVLNPTGAAFEHLGDFVDYFNLSIHVAFAACPTASGALRERVSRHARSGSPCLDLDFASLLSASADAGC